MTKFPAMMLSGLLGATPLAAGAADIDLRVIVSGEIAPGLYGRVELGHASPPPLLYAKPVIIMSRPGPPPRPVYLHVPPGHAKHWGKHCHKYRACGHPVYFVKSAEYEPGYRPRKEKKEKREK